ncbi:MAG TPA: IS110 family transposase [Roseiflexaceae bacterium]|nr:IS110 family transposase [Roseiflexaceae bacterium]
MRRSSSQYRLFVGIDVAATTCAVSWMCLGAQPARAITIKQTPAGFADLQRQIQAIEPDAHAVLIVMEATGTYWMRLASSLSEAGFAVSVINPAQAHDFAKALLKRSKTDAIDAQTLAELGARLQPERWSPPPQVYTELAQRLVHRDGLVAARTQLRNQLHALMQQPIVIDSVRTRLESLIATLDEEIATVEQEIASALEQDVAWAAAAARLATIKGLGTLTIAWVLTTTINFTLTATPEAAANYAGLAPQLRQSGSSVRGRPRVGHGGNARLRRAVYMASLSAIQHNPVIKAFYTRLRAAGKPRKVALCAAARKLLRIAWAVATKEQDFDPTYASRLRLEAVAE